jgi:hypothetical protein
MTESITRNKESSKTRYPRLDTVIMLENHIKEHDGEFKKRKLWESLPKKMMYQTYCAAIDYLFTSRKISIDAEGKVGWTYYPEQARYWLSRTDLGREDEKKFNNKIRERESKNKVLQDGRKQSALRYKTGLSKTRLH